MQAEEIRNKANPSRSSRRRLFGDYSSYISDNKLETSDNSLSDVLKNIREIKDDTLSSNLNITKRLNNLEDEVSEIKSSINDIKMMLSSIINKKDINVDKVNTTDTENEIIKEEKENISEEGDNDKINAAYEEYANEVNRRSNTGDGDLFSEFIKEKESNNWGLKRSSIYEHNKNKDK